MRREQTRRLQKLEGVNPSSAMFEHFSDEELDKYIRDEGKALIAEAGSLEVFLVQMREIGPSGVKAAEWFEKNRDELGFPASPQIQ